MEIIVSKKISSDITVREWIEINKVALTSLYRDVFNGDSTEWKMCFSETGLTKHESTVVFCARYMLIRSSYKTLISTRTVLDKLAQAKLIPIPLVYEEKPFIIE